MIPIKCAQCKRDINRGGEMSKAIIEYMQPDGSLVAYGWDRPAGKLKEYGGNPQGKMFRAWHYKHFRVAEKRERRGGDAITGRGMGLIPTAYEITAMTANQDELAMLGITEEEARSMSTQRLTDMVVESRRSAAESGIGADNWNHKEKMRAQERGGPYDHRHMLTLEDFQIKAHLLYAHGEEPLASAGGRKGQHAELHAKMELEKKIAAREADAGYQEAKETDWRDQEVFNIENLPTSATRLEEEDLAPVDAPGSSGETISFDDVE